MGKKKELENITNEIGSFIFNRKGAILIIFLALILIHGPKLFSVNVGVDTEGAISMGKSFYNGWLSIGRQGLVLIKMIDGTLIFNPFFASIIMMLCLFLSYIFIIFVIEEVFKNAGMADGKINNAVAVVGAILFFSQPIITEQIYFTLQCAEIAEGFLLTFIGVYAAYLWAKNSGWISLFISLISSIVAFCVYQSFVPVFIQLTIFILLIESLSDKETKSQILCAVKMAVVFLIAFVINFVTSKLFFYGSDYVSSQSRWGTDSLSTILRAIASHVFYVQRGEGIYYFFFYSVFVVLFWFTFFITMKGKKTSQKVWQLILLLFMLASPYFLTIITGGVPVARSQFNLPLAALYMLFYCYEVFSEVIDKKNPGTVLSCVLLIVAVVGCWQQTKVTERLYYSDAARYQQDQAFGYDLISEIDKEAAGKTDEPTVIILGRKEAKLNPSCIQGEVMGHSLFDWDVDVEPMYYYSSHRMVGFLNTLGAGYKAPTLEQFNALQAEFENCKDDIFIDGKSVGKWNNIYVVRIK